MNFRAKKGHFTEVLICFVIWQKKTDGQEKNHRGSVSLGE